MIYFRIIIASLFNLSLALANTPANSICQHLKPLIDQQLYTATTPAYPYILPPRQQPHPGQVVGAIIGIYDQGQTCYYSFGRTHLNSIAAPTPTTRTLLPPL